MVNLWIGNSVIFNDITPLSVLRNIKKKKDFAHDLKHTPLICSWDTSVSQLHLNAA